MSTERSAEVEWIGGLMDGEGKIVRSSSSRLDDLEVTWNSRLESEDELTSPEELVAAGLAACYAMSVAHTLVGGGWEPEELRVGAGLGFEPGRGITGGSLTLNATVEGISDEKLWEVAERAKLNCPVANALSGVDLDLDLPGVERSAEESVEPEPESEPELDEAHAAE